MHTTPLSNIADIAARMTKHRAQELRIVHKKDPGGKSLTFKKLLKELSKATKTKYPDEFDDLIVIRESEIADWSGVCNKLVDEHLELKKKYEDLVKSTQSRQ